MSIVFGEMVFPVCNQGYSIAWEAAVSLSLLVADILFSLLSDGLSLSLLLALCQFSPVSVYMFYCDNDITNVNSTGIFD